jgi:glycosyltransferase involved in cell wall biosynthesis
VFKLPSALLGALDTFTTTIHGALRDDSALREQVRAADVVEIHWGVYAPLIPAVRRIACSGLVTVFLHDVLTSVRQARALTPGVRRRERLIYAVSGRASRRQEWQLYSAADVVIVLSDADRRLVHKLGVTKPVHIAEPWLERPLRPLVPASAPVAVFVGALRREENARAVEWLLASVWPSVMSRLPSAQLRVVGGGAPSWLDFMVAGSEGVRLIGFVDDLDGEYQGARVALAPLSDPSGMKVKVAQAMALGLPVVATTAAVTGFPDAPPRAFGAVTDDPEVFAAAVTTLLATPGAAEDVGRRAAQWCAGRFDLDAEVDRYEELLAELWLSRPRK